VAHELLHYITGCVAYVGSVVWDCISYFVDSALWLLSFFLYYVVLSLYKLLLVLMLLLKSVVYCLYLVVTSVYQSRDVWGPAILSVIGFGLNIVAESLRFLVFLVNQMFNTLYVP
jgi:hypothetical protein